MIVLKNTCVEVASRWYINSIIKEKQIVWVYRLLAICRDVFCSNWVTRESQEDILMQGVQIHDCSYTERRKEKNGSLYGGYKLFLSKDRFEVVRVDCNIASIPPFRIDVPLSSESIWFGAEITRVEPDDKVELGEVLGPLYLPLGQYLGSRKILKVLMIHTTLIGQAKPFKQYYQILKASKMASNSLSGVS